MLAKEACRLSSPDKKRSSSCLLQPRNVKKTKGAPTIFISVWEYNLLMVQFSRYIPFPLWMHNYSSFWISWVKLWGFASIGTRGAQKNSEKTLQVCKVTFWLGSLHALCDLEEEKVPFWLDWEWCRSLGWPHKVNSYQCLTQLCVSNIVGLSFLIITAHPVFFPFLSRVWVHIDYPVPISLLGYNLKTQFSRNEDFSPAMVDAITRATMESDDLVYKESTRRWRHFLPSRFSQPQWSTATATSKHLANGWIPSNTIAGGGGVGVVWADG